MSYQCDCCNRIFYNRDEVTLLNGDTGVLLETEDESEDCDICFCNECYE